jgi:periplasmic divalent cation tolerance protein
MSAPCFVYVTTKDRAEACEIGRTLVEARLVACANVFDPVTSIYWWEGAVQEDAEAVLVMKTQADLVAALTERVKEIHSYDCPCVVALPIEGGNPAYLDWIGEETSAVPSQQKK